MQTGDKVRVVYNGHEGIVEYIIGPGRIMVKEPVTLRNGQPGSVSKEYQERNLEVINNAKR